MSVVLDSTIYIDSFSFLISWTDSGMMAVDVALYRVGGELCGFPEIRGTSKECPSTTRGRMESSLIIDIKS